MNIFKELAYGNGSVKENSVNAFLAYLLNPNKDHGLNDAFLKSFLGNLTDEIKKNIFKFKDDESEEEKYLIPDLHNKSSYNVDVFVEKNFTGNDKSDINRVDIILKITQNIGDRQNQDNTIVFDIEVKPIAIFLIEVKISDSAATENQIMNQLTSAINSPANTNWKDKIYHIYVSPNENNCNDEFQIIQEIQELQNKCIHIFWDKIESIDLNKSSEGEGNKKRETNTNYSILKIIKLIVKQEEEVNAEPIDDYCKQTLKAFCNFITSGFTGKITENKTKEGKGIPVILQSLEDYFTVYRENLNDTCNIILSEFNKFLIQEYPGLTVRHSKTHPISIFTILEGGNEQGIKIGSLSKNGRNIRIFFDINNFRNDAIKTAMVDKINNLNFHNYSLDDDTIILRNTLTIDQIKDLFTFYFKALNLPNATHLPNQI